VAKKNKVWTLKDFEKEVQHLDPNTTPEEPAFKTGVLLLSALHVGANINRLTKFTGYPKDFVRDRVKRCRENGIFVGGEVVCGWFDENGGIAFWMDVLVADGLLAKRKAAVVAGV